MRWVEDSVILEMLYNHQITYICSSQYEKVRNWYYWHKTYTHTLLCRCCTTPCSSLFQAWNPTAFVGVAVVLIRVICCNFLTFDNIRCPPHGILITDARYLRGERLFETTALGENKCWSYCSMGNLEKLCYPSASAYFIYSTLYVSASKIKVVNS